MKRYLKKNIGYGEPSRLHREPLCIQTNPNSFSIEDFKHTKNCLKRTFFNGGFRIFLLKYPVPP
jgi:hypothetical protein